MQFFAKSIKDLKAKIKAAETLDLEVVNLELFGTFSDEDEGTYKENKDLHEWCVNRPDTNTEGEYHDDNRPMSGYVHEVVKISSKWITIKFESGNELNVCFPRNPEQTTWKSDAMVIIECKAK